LLPSYIRYFSITVTKIPVINNLKGDIFILAHSFTGFSSWSLGTMCLGRSSQWQEHVAEDLLHLIVEAERESERDRNRPGTTNPQRPTPTDLHLQLGLTS
jgi:hypothetical protein